MAPRKKIAIVGGASSRDLPTFPWHERKLPNVTDFDITILDFRAASIASTAMTLDAFNRFHGLLSRQLNSGGEIVAVADDLNVKMSVIRSPKNFLWSCKLLLPVGVDAVTESGDTVERVVKRFDRYLSAFRSWRFHFQFTAPGVLPDLEPFVGKSQCYLRNREGRWLAGEITSQSGRGRQIVLPARPGSDQREAIDLIVEELLGGDLKIDAPPWINEVTIPGIAEIDSQIARIQRDIEARQIEQRVLGDRRISLSEFSKLLYAEGPELEAIVQRVLRDLGGETVPKKYGTEEYILVHENREHLIEVKGVSKSAAVAHVRQLLDNQLAAEETSGSAPHCILVVNAWRNEPPSSRNSGDRLEVPGQCRKARSRK